MSITKNAGDGKNYNVIPTAIEVRAQSTILTSRATLKDSRVDFEGYLDIPPVPLVKPKPGSAPPVSPLIKVDLRAKGTMKFAMSMESIFNPETDMETVDIPFEFFTAGSQAVISFKIPGFQDLTFYKGTVTRKGKK